MLELPGESPTDQQLARLELELRQLTDVSAVMFDRRGDLLRVDLLVGSALIDPGTEQRAEEIARSYIEGPVRVAVGSLALQPYDGTIERVRLLQVLSSHERGATEVVLWHRGSHSVGRVTVVGARGAAAATLQALRGLGARLPFHTVSTVAVPSEVGGGVLVVLAASGDGPDRLGVARGTDEGWSASRATLDALNRYLSEPRAFAPRPSSSE